MLKRLRAWSSLGCLFWWYALVSVWRAAFGYSGEAAFRRNYGEDRPPQSDR